MKNQAEHNGDCTDLGTFLVNTAQRLIKEGNSLRALAGMWFEEGDEERVLRQCGIDISELGEQLLVLQSQLCKDCTLKSVTAKLSFDDSLH